MRCCGWGGRVRGWGGGARGLGGCPRNPFRGPTSLGGRRSAALKVFIAERPEDSLAADAMLRLGRAYQAMGMYDEAIGAFHQNLIRHPNSLAASKSAVPLAAAYIAKGPDFYPKAERTLQDLL